MGYKTSPGHISLSYNEFQIKPIPVGLLRNNSQCFFFFEKNNLEWSRPGIRVLLFAEH